LTLIPKGEFELERRSAAIAIAATIVVLALVLLIIAEPWKEGATLAESAIIRPDDISEPGWSLHGEYDMPYYDGASSFREVRLYKDTLRAYVFVYAFDSAELAQEHYRFQMNNLAPDAQTESIDAGDDGVLIWRANGNGSCSLFFYNDNLFVWMDLITGQYGDEPWDDVAVVDEALLLANAQDLKFSTVLGS